MWSLCLHVSLDGFLLSRAFEADGKTEFSTWNVGTAEIADGFLQRYQKFDKGFLGDLQTVVVDEERFNWSPISPSQISSRRERKLTIAASGGLVDGSSQSFVRSLRLLECLVQSCYSAAMIEIKFPIAKLD